MGYGLLHHLSRADRALGRLDGATETLPDPDLFVFMYIRKEAVLSSQIEGTQASLTDVLEFEARMRKANDPHDVQEVINYISAMRHGLERLSDLPVSLRLIREIHRELLQGVRGEERDPGQFRRSQNWIGPPGCTLDEAVYVPPPPHELLSHLGHWETFLHEEDLMPDLVKVGLLHAQLETIHPFLDGNGRVGRLVITFLLCEQGILRRPLLYLSYFFKQHRQAYYDRLQAVRDEGDWEGWTEFFLRGVGEVAADATRTARKIVSLRERHRAVVTEELGGRAGSGLRLLESAFSEPFVSVNRVASIADVSFSTANRLVADLCDLGILAQVGDRKRNRIFRYDPYLDLFRDEETDPTARRPDAENEST